MVGILWVILVFFGLLLPFVIAVLFFYFIYAGLSVAPYVGARVSDIDKLLASANFTPNQVFIDLGSGDGRVVRRAAQLYRIKGRGVELNPLLVWYSHLCTRIIGANALTFRRGNLFHFPIHEADVVYTFANRKTIAKVAEKFRQESKPGALFISHGFIVPKWDRYLVEEQKAHPFSTYYYKLPKN